MSISSLTPATLESHPSESEFGLSARRLWEHSELGQISVFAQAISARQELNDPAAFIDVVSFASDHFMLAGFTLADLKAGRIPAAYAGLDKQLFAGLADAKAAVAFIQRVAAHLDRCSLRRATRDQHAQFLPPARSEHAFGVPHLFSTLRHRLRDLGKSSAAQWQHTIANFQKKGLRAEELSKSGLVPALEALAATGRHAGGADLIRECDFAALRLSVIPVVNEAQRQLQFASTPARALTRTKKLPKAQAGQARTVVGFDRVLGYRIEQIEHQALWGLERHWQAVTHGGQVLRDETLLTLFDSSESASALAAGHARQHFPKRVALGRWGHIAWTGGEDYREWLITLPYYPTSYFSSHFSVRNILAHVRCDVREGADGERVLLLQEVQSDWAQNVRRAVSAGMMGPDDPECPPFWREWPALAMKLVLLHAAHQGLDAVAWTRGAHQVFRYNGLGATGLTELYDRTLPREVSRMLKPFGVGCETLGVFVPTNFSIKRSENGYEVYTAESELLGTAPTLEGARNFVPDGGHELLYEVHGVRVPASIRKAILEQGFPAWG
jgi:hypothetical protein